MPEIRRPQTPVFSPMRTKHATYAPMRNKLNYYGYVFARRDIGLGELAARNQPEARKIEPKKKYLIRKEEKESESNIKLMRILFGIASATFMATIVANLFMSSLVRGYMAKRGEI